MYNLLNTERCKALSNVACFVLDIRMEDHLSGQQVCDMAEMLLDMLPPLPHHRSEWIRGLCCDLRKRPSSIGLRHSIADAYEQVYNDLRGPGTWDGTE